MVRRALVMAACCGTLALSGCGGGSSSAGVSTSLGAKSLPSIKLPEYLPGPLNGESTPRSVALRRPLAVIVENYDPDSRPQSGLGSASMVIETLAEGGVTRFMALYLEHDAPKVGPVRSARMYFNNWAGAFHAILAHVGGNDDAQARLWQMSRSVFNIDENRWEVSLTNTGTSLFWRSADRVPPHNMYTSTIKLRAYAAANKQNWTYTQAYLLHKQPSPPARRGRIRTISITFSDPLAPHDQPGYDVQYRYDPAANTYLRLMGGRPHVDDATGKPLAPANVIVVHTGPAVADPAAGPTPESILIPTLGSGNATYFRDGTVEQGIWQQANAYAPLRFFDARGRQVAFNPGQTWVEVLPSGSSANWS